MDNPKPEYLPPRGERAARHSKAVPGGSAVTQPPPGFPLTLSSPLAWTRNEMEGDAHKYILRLSDEHILALETGLRRFGDFPRQGDISDQDFPLPNDLVRELRRISDQCYRGPGFAVIKGLDPTKYTAQENLKIYAGIAAHVAPHHGFVNHDRTKVVAYVMNEENGPNSSTAPGFTKDALAFHTDSSEILSLFAINVASEGGSTLISSGYRLYNQLAQSNPQILHTLSETWVLDTFQDPAKYPPIHRAMLHAADANNVSFTFSRYPMTGYKKRQRNPSLPPPTEAQLEALDTVQHLLEENSIALPWDKGDIVFINDMAIFHARTAFQEQEGSGRELVKFYLHDPKQQWPVASTAQENWNKLFVPKKQNNASRDEWNLADKSGENSLSNG